MPLSAHIKRILNGLAYAHAGDYLSVRQKAGVLSSSSPNAEVQAGTSSIANGAGVNAREGAQIALYLGGELPESLMEYVLRTCGRMQYGLTVLTLQTRKEAQALLAPYEGELAAAGIAPQVIALSSEPTRALAQALRRRPEIAFLVCNESGYLGRSLLNGGQHVMPVPVVLVSPNGVAANTAAPGGAEVARSRAA